MKPEYRPCEISEILVYHNGEQKITKAEKHKALFHGWIKKTEPTYETKPFGEFIAKKYIGNNEILVALVELEDGTICECSSDKIKFTDNKTKHMEKDEELMDKIAKNSLEIMR